jgi:hypothetical protein
MRFLTEYAVLDYEMRMDSFLSRAAYRAKAASILMLNARPINAMDNINRRRLPLSAAFMSTPAVLLQAPHAQRQRKQKHSEQGHGFPTSPQYAGRFSRHFSESQY